AGDPATMRDTVRLAREHGVAVGAHPGFADREHFGRRDLQLPPRDIEALVARQIDALAAIAADAGIRLQHVKPHGALFNIAARDPDVDTICVHGDTPGAADLAARIRAALEMAMIEVKSLSVA